MSRVIECAVCGTDFDPDQSAACEACPLYGSGCSLVCCPACGHVTVDVERSRLARLAQRVFRLRKGPREARLPHTLRDVPPGTRVVVCGFRDGIPVVRKEQLRAYGLSPGRSVEVVQHTPVTVIRIDHTQLALEGDLAESVLVGA